MRAKFIVTSIEEFLSSKTAKLQPVADGSDENKSFSKYTPSGELRINIDKDTPAADFLKVGKSYYMDFTEAQ